MQASSTTSEKSAAATEYAQSYLINQQTLNQMIKDTSLEIFPMLVQSFLEEAELRGSNIIQAIKNDDFKTLEFEAHTLGSTALAMGATGLGLMARKMERCCLEGKPEQAAAHKDEFQALTKQSKAAFAKALTQYQT